MRYPVWEEFSAAMSSKFDKDQHDLLIRQMDQIRQTGTVWEFYERFDELMNQLLAYDLEVNIRYLIHRFTEGLCREIRNVVLLHRPRDLETALAIASLQEEVLEVVPESNHSKPFRRSDGGVQSKNSFAFKGAFPLPLPPGSGGVHADDKKHQDGQHATGLLDKMSSIKAHRRAQGLCYICAEKWSPAHKCATTVQLHAVQELFSLLQDGEQSSLMDSENLEEQSGPSVMAVSVQAIVGSESGGTMRLLGWVQGFEVLILVDSGSSASFVSSQIAASLAGAQ